MKKNFDRKPKSEKNGDNEKEFSEVKADNENESGDEMNIPAECNTVTNDSMEADDNKGDISNNNSLETVEKDDDNHNMEESEGGKEAEDLNSNDDTITKDTLKDDESTATNVNVQTAE